MPSSRAGAWSSRRCASTSRATTRAPSTGTSPPAGRALRQEVRGGARPRPPAGHGRFGLAVLRLAVHRQARLRGRAGRRCWPSPRWRTRTGWARCSSPTASSATCPRARGREHALRIVRDAAGRGAPGPGHRPRGRPALRPRRDEAARHRGRPLRLPGRGLRAVARGPAPAARRGGPAPPRSPRDASCPTRGSWPCSTRRPASAGWWTSATPTCGGGSCPTTARAPGKPSGARSVDALPSRHERLLRAAPAAVLRGAGAAAVKGSVGACRCSCSWAPPRPPWAGPTRPRSGRTARAYKAEVTVGEAFTSRSR